MPRGQTACDLTQKGLRNKSAQNNVFSTRNTIKRGKAQKRSLDDLSVVICTSIFASVAYISWH